MKNKIYHCDKCGRIIGGHNQFLHNGMCDDCFFETYFPEEVEIFEKDAVNLVKRCEQREIENTIFLHYLKSDKLNKRRFNNIVKEVEKKIDCTTCGNCCKRISPDLRKKDIEIISEFLNLSQEEFVKRYLRYTEDGLFQFNETPCPFLQQKKCTIYETRPAECKQYPNLDKDITTRCIQFFSNAEICPLVYNVLENTKIILFEEIYDNEFELIFQKNPQ
jgi:hypothetical protein